MSDEGAGPTGPSTSDSRPVLATLGRYVLRQELASGGMASVFLAHLSGPHGFEKAVALKQIHPHLAKDRRFVEMFLDEARVAAMIHHPNVCAIIDFGEQAGTPYLVLEYLNGESMSSVVDAARATGDAPLWLFARIVHDAARGLHAAHQLSGPDGRPLGVVHRDVSPHNIFVLYDGVTKVVDFGVARARGRLSATQSNEVKGKLPYMSPEQFDEGLVDHRTDIWALGVVLWETTVGRRLFRGESDAATIAGVLHKPILRPSDYVPDYPPALEAVVMRCLERDASRRFESAEQLADALEEYLYTVGKPAGASQVKRWMHEHFDAEIAHRTALLRGEAPAPLVSRYTGTAIIAAAASPLRSEPRIEVRDGPVEDLPTAFVKKRHHRGSSYTPQTDPLPTRDETAPTADPHVASLAAGSVDTHTRADVSATPVTSSPRGRLRVPLMFAAALIAASLAYVVWHGAREDAVAPHETASTRREVHAAPTPPTPPTPPSPAPLAAVAPQPAPEATSRALDGGTTPPATNPRVATTAAVPRERGRLNLIAVPNARVRIDGRSVGETPLIAYTLAVGDHRVELSTDDGRRRSLTVRIVRDELTRTSVRF